MPKYCLRISVAILFYLFALPGFSQYYLRGEVKNPQGAVLCFAKIKLVSKGASLFTSGSSGGFGIPLSQKEDTIIVMLDGYKTLKQVVAATSFQRLILQPANHSANETGSGLMSLTKSIANNKSATTVAYGGETYTSLAENDFVKAKDAGETSLALNINNASYSNIRRFLNMNATVPPDGVRIEEMLNYFNLNKMFDDSVHSSFQCETQLTTCPWNGDNRLLFINILAPKISFANIAPAKFIFLIDVSGSMDKDNRLPLIQSAFKFLVNNLREQDTVGIVTYGGYVGIALEPTSGSEKEKINKVIDALHADGDTPGSVAIQTAYELSEKMADTNSNNRVILATDGDFNIGQTSDKELEMIVNKHKQNGIYLTCLGTGMGNYKDSRLEMLAKKGNGNFAYIDNIQEAQKTMVAEFTKNMYAVAGNTSLHIRFNASAVKSYRLIGYDNRKDALQDTLLMTGGEIGSGQNTMAVFEIEPASTSNQPLAAMQLFYHTSQNDTEKIKTFTADNSCLAFDSAGANIRFATAVCMFGSLLKHSKFVSDYNWDTVEKIALHAYDDDNASEKEFIGLIKKAKEVYAASAGDKKRKKAAK